MNEKLILRALKSIIEKQHQSFGDEYPYVYLDLEEAINPTQDPLLTDKTGNALRGGGD